MLNFLGKKSEQRSQERVHRSKPIAWRYRQQDEPRSAVLLESSELGFAFAWRGNDAPNVDNLIEVFMNPDRTNATPIDVRVKRVTKVHDDLVVIAAELWFATPFPPAVESAAIATSLVEPRVTLTPAAFSVLAV